VLRVAAVLVWSIATFQATPVHAQSAPAINASPAILVEPGAETPLPILIGPQETIPENSFLRLRGLPPNASLTEGHTIAPGSWAIPLAALPALKISLPIGLSGKADVHQSRLSRGRRARRDALVTCDRRGRADRAQCAEKSPSKERCRARAGSAEHGSPIAIACSEP
jgi:hypothetical protein